MDGRLFGFIAGSFSALLWTALPSVFFLFILLLIAILCLRFRPVKMISWFLLGIIWMASVGHWQRHWQLPLSQVSNAILVSGQIQSLINSDQQSRFNLRLSAIEQQKLSWPRHIRLTWKQTTWPVKQGQEVVLRVKLKPAHGLANEGGFHYQQWLFSEGLTATGYVKDSDENRLLSAGHSLRQDLLDKLLISDIPALPWIAALAFGYRGLLQLEDWQLVQRTGIAHLIAISGLHLALVASLSYGLFCTVLSFVVQRLGPSHSLNVHRVALCGVVLATFFYASLAGLALPTVRAWIMLTLVSILLLADQNWPARRILLLSLFIFVLFFPLSIFALSFWLSFFAVMIIWFIFWCWPAGSQGFSLKTFFITLVRIQLALSVLMLPLVAWQFSYISFVSPLVNLLAVPLVTLILVPLCLAGIILLSLNTDIAYWLFTLAGHILEFSLQYLAQLSTRDWVALNIKAAPASAWLFAGCGAFLLLAPRFLLAKKQLVVLFLPLLSHFFRPDTHRWRVDVLDVGQGVSVLITRNHHALLYDVGAAYPSGFNMADAVILPLLQARGITELDRVFVSHSDNDHSGSLPQLGKGIVINQLITTADLCRRGRVTRWQGLNLEVLWPDDPLKYNDNNGSCVLKISDTSHSLLLPGDIDAGIEAKLLEMDAGKLQADILLAAHHGSNTSSSLGFINAVAPDYVVFSQGFMNRWSFPRAQVLERYGDRAKPYLTSQSGQISFILELNFDEPIAVSTFRLDHYPYWYANHY
ncbi:MAG: competence protein ComEC [Paraglaciecola sp.]|jgi:competence protein ComEC